jgi:AAA family ATP:ADP antiporter
MRTRGAAVDPAEGQSCWRPSSLLATLTDANANEQAPLFWSFACFFMLLCSYSILRPLRDEMGIANGVGKMPWLFSATFISILVAALFFSCATSRVPKVVLLPGTYWFFLSHIGIFFLLFRIGVARSVAVPAFFVWLSVFNLLVVSAFWSFMTDVFTGEQGKRLFGFIASGGSAGALAGPALTAAIAPRFEPLNLFLISACFLLAAIGALRKLTGFPCVGTREDRIGRGEGVRLESPSLAGTGFLVVGYATLSTLLYIQQAEIVSARIAQPAARTAFFASVDLGVNATTLLLQVFVSGRLMKRFGLEVTLAAVPFLVAAGFLALSFAPVLPLLVAVLVIHRAGSFTLLRPGREVLYASAPSAGRHKAKSFIDTVVYRGSDAAGAWIFGLMRGAGLGLGATAGVGVPIALLWMVAGFTMGRRHEHRRRAGKSEGEASEPPNRDREWVGSRGSGTGSLS